MPSVLTTLSFPAALSLLMVCTVAILWTGPRLTEVVDQVGDRSGWGEALEALRSRHSSSPWLTSSIDAPIWSTPRPPCPT
jgi:hypothetical protein